MAEATRRVRLRITGRVQGVGFRVWLRDTAEELGVTGWVRNQPDGSVAALAAGREGQVEALLQAARSGPPGAEVGEVAVQDAPGDELPSGFVIEG
jgi:acylphosphatase